MIHFARVNDREGWREKKEAMLTVRYGVRAGAIDIDELRAVLATLGQDDITDEKLQSMFDTMDEVRSINNINNPRLVAPDASGAQLPNYSPLPHQDGNGTIDFLEFLSMMTQKMEVRA